MRGVLGGGGQPVAPGRGRLRCRGAGGHRRAAARGCRSRRDDGRRETGAGGVQARRAGRARAAGRRSARRARATTTALPSGVRDVSTEHRQARRPQGRRHDRAGEHARELRRGARGGRRHDRVRRAAAPGDGRLVLAHDYEDAHRATAVDAGRGSRPPGVGGVRRSRVRRRPEAARLRARGGRRRFAHGACSSGR